MNEQTVNKTCCKCKHFVLPEMENSACAYGHKPRFYYQPDRRDAWGWKLEGCGEWERRAESDKRKK